MQHWDWEGVPTVTLKTQFCGESVFAPAEVDWSRRVVRIKAGGALVGFPMEMVHHIGLPATVADDPRHLCPDCGQVFETAQGLGSHRARKHGDDR